MKKSAFLCIGNLPPTVTASEIYGIFVQENITGILAIRVERDINTSISTGYAYVNFVNENQGDYFITSFFKYLKIYDNF